MSLTKIKIGNKTFMTKNEYISNIENLIINRIKYHAPRIEEEVDYPLLEAVGIDGSYPIFIFDKPLDKIFYKAFLAAKKRAEFNLVLTQRPKLSSRKIDALDKCFVILKDEIGSSLERALSQLNVNYLTHSNFDLGMRKEFIKIEDKEIAFDFLPFYYGKKVMEKGVVCDVKSYLLNGKNYQLNFANTTKQKQTISFEFNLPLPRGYYIFKNKAGFVEIENLTNKEKAYFNYNFRGAKLSFSNLNGIESSTFACINLICKIYLLPKETRRLYFNYGENKYCILSPKDMQEFFEISQRKMNEIFDIKVTTRNSEFDELFNRYLPRNIWEKWQKFDIDEESEKTWLKMKNEIVKTDGKALQISQTFKGLKEVKFFRNYGWKRVFIVHNKACYLFADRVKYFNFTLLTKEIFDKNNEIYLSFAE